MSKQLTTAIIGLGGRGKDTYARYTNYFPEKLKIVAIADLVKEKVDIVAEKYNIAPEKCFNTAEELLEQNQLADIMFVCTQDRDHVRHGILAMQKGYHLILEKPISPDMDECLKLLEASKIYNKRVVVCHVLRYTCFYKTLKEIIESGRIGDVVTIQAIENVGYWHQAHSFVRGNWRRKDETSPMILAKCCHDVDILLWLANRRCERVSSYGSTYLFKSEMAPEGATKMCFGGCKCKDECPYDAEKIYLDSPKTGVRKGCVYWPSNVVALVPTEESMLEALKTGPYGRCVYYCDNDVVDHQILNMELEGGVTINFTMTGFTEECNRNIKIMGSKGEITGDMNDNTITVSEFGKKPEVIEVAKLTADFSGHGGGENNMIHDFLGLLTGESTKTSSLTSIDVSVESHVVALASEISRLEKGRSIEISDFMK